MRIFIAIALLCAASLAAFASDGGLDTTFGSNGLGLSGITGAQGNYACGPVIQPDGKILICDTSYSSGPSGYDFFVARFNANGTLDPSFSFDGKVTVDFAGGPPGLDSGDAVVLQADGKIVLVGATRSGNAAYDFAIARLNSDGILDTSFGVGTGKTTVAFDLGGGPTAIWPKRSSSSRMAGSSLPVPWGLPPMAMISASCA